MSNDSDSFFQEVDEGVRQDRYMAAAKRLAPWAAAALAIVIVTVVATQLWQAHEQQVSEDQAVAFTAAQEQAGRGEVSAAATRFEAMSRQGPEIYRVMAMMERGAMLEAQGDMNGALAAFDGAAASAKDPLVRDTARMRAAYIVADTQDFQAVQLRLQPLIQGGGQISYLAKELLGVEAWEAGQTELARSTLSGLQLAFDAPESVRRRAQLELSALGAAPAPRAGSAPAAPAPAPPSHGEAK